MRQRFRLKFTLLQRFSILSFVLLAGIAIALSWVVQERLEKNALGHVADDVADQATSILDPTLSVTDLTSPLRPDRYAQLDELVHKYVISGRHIVRVKVWNRDGVIVYSDAQGLVGQRFPITEELEAALAGEVGSEVSSLDREENVYERGRFSRLFEVYVPIKPIGSSQIVGAYEIYHDLAVLASRIEDMRRVVWTGAGLGFLILYVSLFTLVRSASRELSRRNGENVRLYNEAKQQLAELERAQKALQRNYQVQTALSALLQVSLLNMTLDEQLQKSLEYIISIPWLALDSKGCILLVEDNPTVLVMKAHHGLTAPLLTMCARVPFGRCLCGRAALSGEIVFADFMDERHENVYEDIAPHSHYCVPILSAGKVLGVMNLHLARGHQRDETEEGFLCAAADVLAGITERKRAEEALRAERSLLRTLIDNLPDAIYVKDRDSHFLVANKWVTSVVGTTPDVALGKTDFDFYPRELAERFYADEQAVMQAGQPLIDHEEPGVDQAGNPRCMLTTKVPLQDKQGCVVGIVGIGHDITDHKHAEEEREKLQAQLLQSQKMDAVGQLTAGIAHDFNNMLTAINGFSQLVQLQMSPDDPLQPLVKHIFDAGMNASDLVRQLMAFSRQQVMEMKVVDLSVVVSDMRSMLQRMIGEDMQMETKLADELWLVKVDPTQLQQVIVNLAVNARDAMPGGGRLALATANAALDEGHAAAHPGVQPGEYVMLAVSDTGCGMSLEVQARIFEPFFTTKEHGKGTGLGLATVYGIVKQSGGHIAVTSEVGVGTTFKVYLPRALDAVAPPPAVETEANGAPGQKTILLVEDEALVREVTCSILERQGYTVLPAARAEEALRLSADHAGAIHLLLTDVIMPGMSGNELSEQLSHERPGLKTLFVSGYTDEVIGSHDVLEPGVAFLQKPFTLLNLTRKVRQMLGMPAPQLSGTGSTPLPERQEPSP